jgi:hypothetical protein
MGPNEAIGIWQQQMHMVMGTNEAISSSRHICQWAHMKASAAAAVYTYANGVAHSSVKTYRTSGTPDMYKWS